MVRRPFVMAFGATALVAICLYLYRWDDAQIEYMGNPHFNSGWLLGGLLILLLSFQWRKALSTLPLGPVFWWTRVHIWLALLAGFVFLIHLAFRFPNGLFEVVFASVFAVTFLSGLFGLWLSRNTELSSFGSNRHFEEFPVLVRKLRLRIEELLLNSITQTKSSTLAQAYQGELALYFSRPEQAWMRVLRQRQFQIQQKLDGLERYLGDEERKVLDELRHCAKQKFEMDRLYTHLGRLRLWLFIHVPLSYALLGFVFWHVWLIYTFTGGPVGTS